MPVGDAFGTCFGARGVGKSVARRLAHALLLAHALNEDNQGRRGVSQPSMGHGSGSYTAQSQPAPSQMPVRLLRRNAVALLLAAVALSSCAADSAAWSPSAFSIDFKVERETCVEQLFHHWGDLTVLNDSGTRRRERGAKICGGNSGNGIGGYAFGGHMPTEPLYMSWRDDQGALCELHVGLASLAAKTLPPAETVRVTVERDGLKVSLWNRVESREVSVPCGTGR